MSSPGALNIDSFIILFEITKVQFVEKMTFTKGISVQKVFFISISK